MKNCAALRRSAPERALEHCNEALGNRLVWGKRKSQVLIDRGALHADRRDWERAIADFDQALAAGSIAPENRVIAFYDRGSSRVQKGELDGAIADLSDG